MSVYIDRGSGDNTAPVGGQMKVDKNKKIHARYLAIEVGTKCNLKCKHCYLGDAPELTIKPEYIDAILENVYEIDDLWLAGGEITLYLDEIELILHKIIEAKIRVNYIGFTTNGVIKSERLVELFERFRKITTFPDKAGIRVSVDGFHSEQSGISEKEMEGVIQWYQDRVGGAVEANRVEDAVLLLDGRALKLPDNILDNYKNIVFNRKIKSKSLKITFNPLCEAEKNACGYGCVKNCFTTSLHLSADGYVYTDEYSYDSKNRSKFALCHIMNSSIYDAMNKWNNDCEKNTEKSFVVIKSDSVNFNFIIMKTCFSWFMLDLADAYERNDFEYMYNVLAPMLDYCIEKWNNYVINNDIKQCIETILVAQKVENLKKIYEVVFKDAIKIPSMQDKELKEYAITKLREGGDFRRICRNIFISYVAKDLDNYAKYFDEALQWVEENDVKSDGMAQLIKENNVQ